VIAGVFITASHIILVAITPLTDVPLVLADKSSDGKAFTSRSTNDYHDVL